MPLLVLRNHSPLEFLEFVRGLYDTMTGLVWYLTAFVASTALFTKDAGIIGARGQNYMLGLGA